MDFIKIVNEAFATGKEHPAFRSGDTITIDYRISEGGIHDPTWGDGTFYR